MRISGMDDKLAHDTPYLENAVLHLLFQRLSNISEGFVSSSERLGEGGQDTTCRYERGKEATRELRINTEYEIRDFLPRA